MIQAHSIENLVVSLKTGKHELVSGLAENIGGKDEGPDPHRLVEAGLAACTIQTCQLYANRKQWPLTSMEVTVQITSETKESSVFKRQIKFIGSLTIEQRQRLFEIANRCPIHRLLMGSVQIQSELIEN